jgi:hypothetical protein
MPYYQGDFYMGDPGFFSFLGRAAKGAVGLGRGLLGLPAAGSGKAISMALPAAAGVATTGIVRRVSGAVAGGAASVGRVISKHPVLSAAAAAGALSAGSAEMGRLTMGAGGVPRGYHIERKGKHPGAIIKNRHMRVTNPRALRRALRRAHGFAKLAMKTIHLVHPRKKGRFGGFRRARKSR